MNSPARQHSVVGRACLPVATVVISSALVVLPYYVVGHPSGYDSTFYLGSWAEYAAQWREGIVWPMWAEHANYRLGDPRLLFYPPLSPAIGGALLSILPLVLAFRFFVFLAALLAGAFAYRLARLYLDRAWSSLAAALYIFAPYTITDAHLRVALAELLALAWLPLALSGLVLIGRGATRRGVTTLAIGVAAVALTNIPAAIVLLYACAATIAGWLLMRSWRRAAAGGIGVAAALALASPYLLAVASELHRIRASDLLRHDFTQNFVLSSNTAQDDIIQQMAVVFVSCAVTLGAAIAARWRNGPWSRDELPLIICGLAGLLLTVPLSAPLWRVLPKVAYVQFPWRWLMLANLVMPVCAVRAMAQNARGRRIALACVTGVFVVVGCLLPLTRGYHRLLEATKVEAEVRSGTPAYGEYTAAGSTPFGNDPGLPQVSTQPSAREVRVERWTGTSKVFSVSTQEATTVTLGVAAYSGWHASCDAQPAMLRGTQVWSFSLPPGEHRCELRLPWPWTRWVGLVLALVAALALLASPAGRTRK